MSFGYDEVWEALEQSVKFQSHYAELLNMYDGGKRISFPSAKSWIQRLRTLDNEKERLKKEVKKVKL